MLGQQPPETIAMMPLINHSPGEARLPPIFSGKASATDNLSILLDAEIMPLRLVKKAGKVRSFRRVEESRYIAVEQGKTSVFVSNGIGPDVGHDARTTVIR